MAMGEDGSMEKKGGEKKNKGGEREGENGCMQEMMSRIEDST